MILVLVLYPSGWRAGKQAWSFEKASYRKSLVKDDVYGEAMNEEYMLNY